MRLTKSTIRRLRTWRGQCADSAYAGYSRGGLCRLRQGNVGRLAQNRMTPVEALLRRTPYCLASLAARQLPRDSGRTCALTEDVLDSRPQQSLSWATTDEAGGV